MSDPNLDDFTEEERNELADLLLELEAADMRQNELTQRLRFLDRQVARRPVEVPIVSEEN